MTNYIRFLNEISIGDISSVGGKNASLGEMYNRLSSKGIRIPNGFAVTAEAFQYFMDSNHLTGQLSGLMSSLDTTEYSNLKETGNKARSLIQGVSMPEDLASAILSAYGELCGAKVCSVAVRSSATAEDLPQASFAGQHESYLNVKGNDNLLKAVQNCFASLYTDRAIKYREDNGFEHDKVALSVGVQIMVHSDKGCSGVGFTLEPESGFRDVVHLSGVWGLGENIVQGTVSPDEFIVFKPTLAKNKKAIIQKNIGSKAKTMVYADAKREGVNTVNIDTPLEMRKQFVLSDSEIQQLAKWAVAIEEHYGKPMDIEWAKDGEDGNIYIVQARPETVHGSKQAPTITEYKLTSKGVVVVSGQAIGAKLAAGRARLLSSPRESNKVQPGDIVVTGFTSPDWDPILKKAAAIVTEKGGRTSHASIVARELGIPAIVGAEGATEKIKDGDLITVSCAEGKTGNVYSGKLDWKEFRLDTGKIKMPELTKVMLIAGDPEKAFKLSFYPNNGVGLMRIEFIINHSIGIHPMALVKFDELKDTVAKREIENLTQGYADKRTFFIDKLSQGVATIAAAFYPKDVIVRMSDFKTNEYVNLLGGSEFEPKEENPMIGFRGASRYYNPRYKDGFKLECEAMKIVRNEMGLTNVKLMIPFCRTVEEGKLVINVMREFGLKQGDNGLEIYVMAEIPSNVMQAEDFGEVFDGFSIGSNDLTQLTLGIDRDSALIANLFSEQNKAAKEMIAMVIEKANSIGKKIGLCGQAPSDYPDFAAFLVEQGIDSISFNPDALLQGIENICKAEARLQKVDNNINTPA
jgi:pyruvate, water dikinase